MDSENVQMLNQLNEQHEMITEQIKIVEQQIIEITTFDEELDIIKSQKNTEILAPIGKSVFAFMKLNDSEKLFVDVGAGYFVRKNIDETKTVASEQKGRLIIFRQQLSEELNNVAMRLDRMLMQHHNS